MPKTNKNKDMKETELAQKFVDYLSCYDLYFEVNYYRSVDIVAIAEKYSIAIEVKTTFNFKVLEQAIENAKHFNFSYIACPRFDGEIQNRLCGDYGIGLLTDNNKYNYYGGVTIREEVAPKLNRHAKLSHLKGRLCDRHKLSLPGSKSGDTTKITAFGVTKESAIRFVMRKNGCTMRELVDGITHHYRSDKAAIANLYQWINAGVIKELEIKDRKVYLRNII